MLQETKTALRVSASAFDADIIDLINAGAADLRLAGIAVKGISFNGSTDNSTLKDPLLKRAIITYVRLHFGSPDDYDRLERAYNEQKAQLISSAYGGLEESEYGAGGCY